MKACVLLTTKNRPRLLAQVLPQIFRQMLDDAHNLIIADDGSTDRATLELLSIAVRLGATVLAGAPNRSVSPHEAIAHNWFEGFSYVADEPNADVMVKIDDDVWLTQGAIRNLIATYERAKADGLDPFWCSGIASVHQPPIEERAGYAITNLACNAFNLWPMAVVHRFVETASVKDFEAPGIDCWAHGTWRPRHFPNSVCITSRPPLALHVGGRGVHARGDINTHWQGELPAGVVWE